MRKKKRPEATIVVPVLADPSTAERTIVSCLGQTVVGRIEIVLVEKETTRTALWSKRYPRARVISSPKADSVVEAHYAGLAAAQAKRIRFLLPGDILESEAIERQIEASQEFDDNVAVVEINGASPKRIAGCCSLANDASQEKHAADVFSDTFPALGPGQGGRLRPRPRR